jgi:hypothetical protein
MAIRTRPLLWSILFLWPCIIVSGIWAQEETEAISEESRLLQAWENIQKNDPQTLLFEKIEDGRYRFKTKWFPYDGELHVYSVIIDKQSEWDPFLDGNVVVELFNLPAHFFEQYSANYYTWVNSNQLFLDPDTNLWISEESMQTKFQSEAQSYPDDYDFQDYTDPLRKKLYITMGIFIFFSIGLIIYMIFQSRQSQRKIDQHFSLSSDALMQDQQYRDQQEKRVQESFQIANETNRLLQEVLDELRK